jgi:hypothetical protein
MNPFSPIVQQVSQQEQVKNVLKQWKTLHLFTRSLRGLQLIQAQVLAIPCHG